MKRILIAVVLLLALGAATAVAQTRAHVSLGFGVLRRYVDGYVVIGRPHYYRRHYLRHPRLLVVLPDLVLLSPRPLVVYRRPYHRHHRHLQW